MRCEQASQSSAIKDLGVDRVSLRCNIQTKVSTEYGFIYGDRVQIVLKYG